MVIGSFFLRSATLRITPHNRRTLRAKLIMGAKEIYYPGRPHGLTATHQDEVNADLLKFLNSVQKARTTAA